MSEPTHEEMLLRIPDFALGRIEGEEAIAVRAHVASCEVCGRHLRTYGLVAEVVKAEASVAKAHPTADDLVGFATATDAPVGEAADEIVAHLESCATCREEVEMVRGAEADLRQTSRFDEPSARRRASATPWSSRSALLAAGLLGAALIYPAYVGLVHYPEETELRAALHEENAALRERLASLETRAPSAAATSAPLAVHFLHATTRGVEDLSRIELPNEVPAEDPVFAVEPWVGTEERGDGTIRFELVDEDAEPLWTNAIPVRAAQDALRASEGVLFFRIPAAILNSGSYRLLQRDSDGKVRVEYRFEVVEPGQRPEATKAPQ